MDSFCCIGECESVLRPVFRSRRTTRSGREDEDAGPGRTDDESYGRNANAAAHGWDASLYGRPDELWSWNATRFASVMSLFYPSKRVVPISRFCNSCGIQDQWVCRFLDFLALVWGRVVLHAQGGQEVLRVQVEWQEANRPISLIRRSIDNQ